MTVAVLTWQFEDHIESLSHCKSDPNLGMPEPGPSPLSEPDIRLNSWSAANRTFRAALDLLTSALPRALRSR